jgi:uncharacterized DUF497 family protein
MNSYLFSWDENKNKSNIKKHGVSFKEARTVFNDENGLYSFDTSNSQDEERFNVIGFTNQLKLLVVCHCYMENDTVIRIISARKASRNEEERYGGEHYGQ